MKQSSSGNPADQRASPRVDMDGTVTVRLAADAISGSGQNISEQGVFFVASGSVPVEVEIEGRAGRLRGQLVRIENLGQDGVGIAVKFDEAHPDLVGNG